MNPNRSNAGPQRSVDREIARYFYEAVFMQYYLVLAQMHAYAKWIRPLTYRNQPHHSYLAHGFGSWFELAVLNGLLDGNVAIQGDCTEMHDRGCGEENVQEYPDRAERGGQRPLGVWNTEHKIERKQSLDQFLGICQALQSSVWRFQLTCLSNKYNVSLDKPVIFPETHEVIIWSLLQLRVVALVHFMGRLVSIARDLGSCIKMLFRWCICIFFVSFEFFAMEPRWWLAQ